MDDYVAVFDTKCFVDIVERSVVKVVLYIEFLGFVYSFDIFFLFNFGKVINYMDVLGFLFLQITVGIMQVDIFVEFINSDSVYDN